MQVVLEKRFGSWIEMMQEAAGLNVLVISVQSHRACLYILSAQECLFVHAINVLNEGLMFSSHFCGGGVLRYLIPKVAPFS
jgi:hypothetical protein